MSSPDSHVGSPWAVWGSLLRCISRDLSGLEAEQLGLEPAFVSAGCLCRQRLNLLCCHAGLNSLHPHRACTSLLVCFSLPVVKSVLVFIMVENTGSRGHSDS